MAAESSSSSLPYCPPDQEQYDVFLSFRGEDTRLNFTSHLHAALCRRSILTFIDDKKIERGDKLSSTLLNAIERCKISIVIFSEKYATSRWCLDELVKIMECKKTVIPIFYHIDPTHVRNQSGPYGDAFANHEIHNQLKVLEWRTTLKKVSNIAGWTSSNRSEFELVESIVEDVLRKLNRNITPKVPSWLVGVNNRIAELKPLLCMKSTGVCIIGIWGMGGIGKTTIAEVLFNTFCSNFQACCFVPNVRENWKKNKQDKLRNKFLTEILGEQLNIGTPSISSYVVDRLQRRRVLIVLDDVSTLEQIEYLVGEKSYFGPGSRIIVTTRNKNVLKMDDKLYEVKLMSAEESLQLFWSKAFPQEEPKVEFIRLSNEAVAYAQGIPLVLKVLGSLLHLKSPKEWKSTMEKLKKIPNEEIHQVLSLSYEGLDSDEQNIFLDIACFLKGRTKCEIVKILNSCDFFTDIGLRNLQDKSLITVSKCNKVEMHDLIQEMGWKIVHQESSNVLEKQSRLWDPEEIYLFLKCKKDTDCSVEVISVDTYKIKDVEIRSHTFARMSKQRILEIFGNSPLFSKLHVSEASLESLPYALRYFRWTYYPLKALPSSFPGEMLVELDLCHCCIEKLWDAEPDLANLESLRIEDSRSLTELSLSKAKNLKEINLRGCLRLQKVSSSIFSLPLLLAVNLSQCISLRAIGSDKVSKSLRWLNLEHCASLVEFSVCSEKLEYLNLNYTAINHLPRFQREKNLLVMQLCRAERLEKVPPIFEASRSITRLRLNFCSNLSELPDSLGLLTELNELSLCESNIERLPETIELLSELKTLNVKKCRRLRSLPKLLISLEYLNAGGCVSLENVASSAAVAHIRNSFNSQNRRLLLRQIQEQKISPRHEDYREHFQFQGCKKLNENALETVVAEAITRIKYAVYLLSIDDDPYHQFHLTSKDFDTQNFEDICRRFFISKSGYFPTWCQILEAESSSFTIKVNANCCEECRASRIAFGLFESENTDFGFDGRHRICMQQMDGRAQLLYNKLWRKDVRFNYPGSRVPSCCRYRTRETSQITITLPAHSHVLGFAFSVVEYHYPFNYSRYSFITCECYSTGSGSIKSECFYCKDADFYSETVYLWFDTDASDWILKESKSNRCFDFRFSLQHDEGRSRLTSGIKECGVWPIYASDLESENHIEFVESGLQPDDLGGDNTSGIEKKDEGQSFH